MHNIVFKQSYIIKTKESNRLPPLWEQLQVVSTSNDIA